MRYETEQIEVSCPFCGEYFTTLVDTSITDQIYIEDCQICCSPITFQIHISDERKIIFAVKRDDE